MQQWRIMAKNSIWNRSPFSGYVSALIALKQKRYSDVVKDCTRELEQHADESHWLPEATLLRATFALIQGNAAMASGDFERFFALMNELPEEERNKRRKVLSWL